MVLERLREMGSSRGRSFSAVDNNGWSSVYMAVFTHPKYVCRIGSKHYTVSMSIDPALFAIQLLQRLDIPRPKATPIKPIIIVAAVINIRVLVNI